MLAELFFQWARDKILNIRKKVSKLAWKNFFISMENYIGFGMNISHTVFICFFSIYFIFIFKNYILFQILKLEQF